MNSVTIKGDISKLLSNCHNASKKALLGTTGRVLADCNRYCPLDTSMLAKSAITSSLVDSDEQTIEWRTPYARKQYYGNYDHSKSHNPNATARWCETAKATFGNLWERTLKALTKRYI